MTDPEFREWIAFMYHCLYPEAKTSVLGVGQAIAESNGGPGQGNDLITSRSLDFVPLPSDLET